MNLETKITIYKFTPQLFTLTQIFLLLAYQSENIENQNGYFTFFISKTAYKIWFCFFIHVYLRLARMMLCFFPFLP